MFILKRPFRIGDSEGEYSLKNARIAYRNLAETASATSSSPDHPPEAVLSPNTYEYWMPQSVTSTLQLNMSGLQEVDCVCIAAHTLGSTGAEVIIETAVDPDSQWLELVTINPASDAPIMILFPKRVCEHVRFRVQAGGAGLPAVGVALVTKALAMQRMIYGGVTPVTMARATDIRPNYSETGQFLGRRIVSEGVEWRASWSNLTPGWYRANFEPFAKAARKLPFFIAWRPETYPNEVSYGWTTSDIVPTNSGTSRGHMSVGISMRGIAAWEPEQ